MTASAARSRKPDAFDAAAMPADRPARAKARAARGLPGGSRKATAAKASAEIHEADRRRSGVSANRPTPISGTTAKTKAATSDRAREPPHARHAAAMIHGTAVASSEVTAWAATGDGAVPPPTARAKTPISPGWSRYAG